MNRLLEIGFLPSGHWMVVGEALSFDLTRHATQKNILYAFICNGAVMYVGKTVRTLQIRMAGYKRPAQSQTTNINNHRRILELLGQGETVEIFALPDNGLLHYGKFHLNLAAALEDDIIRKIDPPWNGGKPEKITDADAELAETQAQNESTSSHVFHFILQPTYFQRGFFNVGVAAQALIGADGETIEIFLGQAQQPVLGTINRTVNNNHTPRIMGGTAVRNWFQAESKVMDDMAVEALSPNSIRLRALSTTSTPALSISGG